MASPSLRLLATPKFQISPVRKVKTCENLIRRIKTTPIKSVCVNRTRDYNRNFRAVKRLDFNHESVAVNCGLKVPEVKINGLYQQKKVIKKVLL